MYYRYMNPAIVAPDAFDIIEVSAGGQLTTEQRRNLGSVAKMLQHAASNKMFLGDNAHLNPINEYLSASYQKFRSDINRYRNIKLQLLRTMSVIFQLVSFFLSGCLCFLKLCFSDRLTLSFHLPSQAFLPGSV